MEKSQTNELLGQYLAGAFDLDCRCASSVSDRAFDFWDAAEQAVDLGMGGLVLRDEGNCTAPAAALLDRTVFAAAPTALYGSVALNGVSGGLNFYAAEHTLALGGRIVSMPTISARNHLRKKRWPSLGKADGGATAIDAIDARGHVSSAAREVLEAIAERDGVLDAGALHISEVLAVFAEARKLGIQRLLLSDPVRRNAAAAIDIEDALDLGAMVAFLPEDGGAPDDLLDLVLRRAPERLILGLNPGPASATLPLRERYDAALRFWLARGLEPATVVRCIRDNPGALLGQRDRSELS
jgi:hypothetical protein